MIAVGRKRQKGEIEIILYFKVHPSGSDYVPVFERTVTGLLSYHIVVISDLNDLMFDKTITQDDQLSVICFKTILIQF